MDPAVASMYSAVVAAAAALFGVIITSLFSHYSSKTSASLKLKGLAFKKRIEAFGRVYEEISRQNEIIEKFNAFLQIHGSESSFARAIGTIIDGECPETIFDDFKRLTFRLTGAA